MTSCAVISDCGKYRYRLTRVWDSTKPRLLWVMLNPSTADATQDDPTIRKVKGFTERAGYGGFDVVNLASFRATDPKSLKNVEDIWGPDYKTHRESALDDCEKVVLAWGANKVVEECPRLFWFRLDPERLLCLGKTKKGHPRHPLYVPYETELQPFEPRSDYIEHCDKCGRVCNDSQDQWWHKENHYCQDCYMTATKSVL